MAGVFFVVCVPSCEKEAKLKLINLRDRVRTHSNATVIFTVDDVNEEIQQCKSTDDFTPPVKRSFQKVDDNPNGACTKPEVLSIKTSWSDMKQAVTSKISSPKPVKRSSENENVTKPEGVPLEKVVSAILEHAKVKDAVWCQGKEKEYYQIFFSLDGGAACEEVLHLFGIWGVGKEWNSVVSVIPCALYYHGRGFRESTDCTADYNGLQNGSDHDIEDGKAICANENRKGFDGIDNQTAWSKFVSSIHTRLTVAQVVQLIRADAALTFDWLFLLIVSAFVAAIGLVENSTVFLVASMLISPLMGPIMAGTFGTAIKDRELQKIGVLHELFGLFLALVIGFLFGLVICGIDEKYGVGDWPTYEMMSRCDLRSLWVGALIAVPSGAAVAIAVLGDNTASLVGVAISASLLPPAVNAGLLWAMALIHLIFLSDTIRFTNVVTTDVYSKNPAVELAVSGTVSLCLTLVNIICIYFGGILVYKIKQVAPINTKHINFWKTDGNTDNKNKEIDQIDESTTSANNKCNGENFENKFNCFRGQSPLFSACAGNHATWSPASLDLLSRPHLKDIETYYQDNSIQKRQRSEDPVILRSSNDRRHPCTRHSLFSPGSAADNIRNILGSKRYKHLSEECSPKKVQESVSSERAENIRRNRDSNFADLGSKFTVTPVSSNSETVDIENKLSN